MSKTILTQVDGFTPLPDLLVTKYGVVIASVWGLAWRYCQMNDGVCRATIENIGKRVGLSRQSTQKHMDVLTTDGFFEDTTPDLRNRPHIYKDTGKVAMYNRFGVKEVDTGVKKIDSGCKEGLHEDSIKDTNKDITPEQRKKEALQRKADQQAKRKDPVDWVIGNLEKERELSEMFSRIEKVLGLDVSGSRFDDLVKFVMKKDAEGQTIEDYAAWMKSDPFNSPKTHQIAQRPAIVRETWLAAFTQEVEEDRPEYKPYIHKEKEGVPNPYEKPAILQKKD